MARRRCCQALGLLAALCLAIGCSGAKAPEAGLSDEEAYQRFVGRWVNKDYPGTLDFTQVTVIRPDHVGEDWQFLKSTYALGEWKIRIRKTWVDEKGYTYVQSYNTRTKPADMQHSSAFLMRVDKKGKVWECCVKPFAQPRTPTFEEAVYPEKIDPSLQWYWIYHREE